MNILVICSDTFRYDHLGFVGRQEVSTPHLARLAHESASFADFWLCSFPTLLNRIEVFTGQYAFPRFKWGPLPFQFPVLAEVFRHHGFTTGLIADNPHLMEEKFGFRRGFEFVTDVPGQADDPFQPDSTPMIELSCPAEQLDARPYELAHYRRNAWWYAQRGTNPTETVFREAMRWLDQPRRKFFLWIDSFNPHEPWDSLQNFLGQYPWNPEGASVFWPRYGKASRYSRPDLANMRSLYKAAVSHTDFWIGRLLDHLRDRQLLQNTAVIFCSDHGFYLGEHDLLGKLRLERPTTIYEELGHVPLLVRHPDGIAAGQTIHGLCQPPDLFPTVLELAGIPRVRWIQGNSLVPRLQGRSEAQRFAVGGCHPRPGNPSCHTVLTDEWCLVYSPFEGLDGSELYHRPTDPTQTRNMITEKRPVAQEHFDLLRSWLEQLDIPGARRRQLLHGNRLGWIGRAQHKLWMSRNRRAYEQHYSDYALTPV